MLRGSGGRARLAARLRALGRGAALVLVFLAFLPGAARAAEPVEMPPAAPARAMSWAEAHAGARRVAQELRSEIEAMKRIAAAQEELMAWNGERARLGLAAMTLRPELCEEAEVERWCRLLPATFGVAEDGR